MGSRMFSEQHSTFDKDLPYLNSSMRKASGGFERAGDLPNVAANGESVAQHSLPLCPRGLEALERREPWSWLPAPSFAPLMTVGIATRKFLSIGLPAATIVFPSSRKERSQRDYLDIFPEDAVSRALA